MPAVVQLQRLFQTGGIVFANAVVRQGTLRPWMKIALNGKELIVNRLEWHQVAKQEAGAGEPVEFSFWNADDSDFAALSKQGGKPLEFLDP